MATAGSSSLDDKKVQDMESPHDGPRDVDVDVGQGGDDILQLEHTDPVLNAKVSHPTKTHRLSCGLLNERLIRLYRCISSTTRSVRHPPTTTITNPTPTPKILQTSLYPQASKSLIPE